MDIDVHADRVAVATLKKNGYRILEDPAFMRSLRAVGIDGVERNDPAKAKHTDTTQRFRVGLVTASGRRVPTKVEFSRRGIEASAVISGRVDPELARRHG